MSIGTSPPRLDGHAKVTGAARYADDLLPTGCLFGATVRSSRPHARVLAVERDPAFDWTGITLVTSADIPGPNVVTLMTDDQPILADGLVRHVTEPIALVAAPDRDRALAAAAAVRVVYEDLPACMDALAAEGHPVRIFGEDNVFKRIAIRRGGAAVGAIEVTGRYVVGLQEQLYIEPQSILAIPRSDAGFTVMGSMQCPYYIDKAVRRMLGHDRLNVVQCTTGGGFGGKEEYPSMLSCHAVLLALKTGRPVKLTYRRDEDLRATTKRHPAVVELGSTVEPDGTLRTLRGRIVMDGGAYHTLSTVVLSRAMLHLTGPYAWPSVDLEGTVVATHTPPNGAFRGFGAPQAQFAMERHMDAIARRLGRDPVGLRRQCLYRDGDISATGQVMREPGGHIVLDRALAAAEAVVPRRTVRPGVADARLSRGRGVSVVFHGCGFTGNGEARIQGKVALELRGRDVAVLIASTDIGQGTETIFPQIVSQELGIGIERVFNAPHDTGVVPDSGPTVASRTAMVVGGVALGAARKLRAVLEARTGLNSSFDALLEANRGAPVRIEHTYEGDPSLVWDAETYQGDAYPTYGWSCTIVDLAVDLDTGEVIYDRMVTATDVGRALNPILATGQIEGGALQALGWATMEEVVLDDRGCMRNDRLTNYIIPTALDAPELVTELVEIPFEGGPFGAKGIGEIPMDGPAAAVAQAIERATGVVLDALPMTPERVLGALHGD
jgi:CO/xanthine dehydrogenase Mo-binding subunit